MATFTKENRLLNKSDFNNLRDGRVVVNNKYLLIKRKVNKCGLTRLGLSVSRKVGPAVVRNGFKRVVREYFRTSKDRLSSNDYLFIAKPTSKQYLFCKNNYLRNVKNIINELNI